MKSMKVLHKELAEKYKVSETIIENLRSAFYEFGLGYEDQMNNTIIKLKRKRSLKLIKHLRNKLEFLAKCRGDNKVWQDVVQRRDIDN